VVGYDAAMKTLTGKTVAITGAASGMGRALALACAQRGAALALVDIDHVGVEATAARVSALRGDVRVTAARVDCGDRDAIYAWAADVLRDHGGADVVVNNAGVSLSASVERMTDEDFTWLFDINFWGVVHGCRAFLPQLRARPEAHLVNISSVFGLIGVPTQSAYCAAKFAVRGFTESLRQELADTHIHVSCVHPGGIKTEIVKRGRHREDVHGNPPDADAIAATFERNARTSAEDAAAVILDGILADKPRILIGPDAHVIDAVVRLLPRRYTALVARAARAQARRPRSSS
jgi:NAD(P)-dependent dehydrogenase (short-subunit alcohol dehydrogenase family)